MKKVLLLLLLLMMLIGCGGDPSPAEGESGNSETAVEPSFADNNTLPVETETETMEEQKDEQPVDPANEPVVSEPVVSEPVVPVEVDFSDLVTGTVEPGEPRVMPAPRVPRPPELEALIQQMIAELGIEETAATVQNIQAVTWRDGSLGCPQPGDMYTMALVEGYQVVLAVGDKLHYFHTNGTNNYLLCDNGKPVDDSMVAPGYGPGSDK